MISTIVSLQKRFFGWSFPYCHVNVFVPSLSWQNCHAFMFKKAKQKQTVFLTIPPGIQSACSPLGHDGSYPEARRP